MQCNLNNQHIFPMRCESLTVKFGTIEDFVLHNSVQSLTGVGVRHNTNLRITAANTAVFWLIKNGSIHRDLDKRRDQNSAGNVQDTQVMMSLSMRSILSILYISIGFFDLIVWILTQHIILANLSIFLFLLNSFNQLQAERDEVFAKFESSIYDVQQKCGLKSLLLQRKVQVLGEKLEKKVTYSNTNLLLFRLFCSC